MPRSMRWTPANSLAGDSAGSSTCSPADHPQGSQIRSGLKRNHYDRTYYPTTTHGRASHMRLGLIGLGRIAAFHANTLAGIPTTDSLVVTDIDRAKVQNLVDRPGFEGVDSLQDFFSAGVDGVVIAASTDAHTELILACVEAGLPTLCEKPVA